MSIRSFLWRQDLKSQESQDRTVKSLARGPPRSLPQWLAWLRPLLSRQWKMGGCKKGCSAFEAQRKPCWLMIVWVILSYTELYCPNHWYILYIHNVTYIYRYKYWGISPYITIHALGNPLRQSMDLGLGKGQFLFTSPPGTPLGRVFVGSLLGFVGTYEPLQRILINSTYWLI